MEKIKYIKFVLSQDWYTQGFNGVPVYLNSCAASMSVMNEYFGFGYSKFICEYKNDYCEYGYLKKDMEKIWMNVKKMLKKDKKYLVNAKNKYEEVFASYEKIFKNIKEEDIAQMSDEDLVKFFKDSIEVMIYSVGIAHILEGVSFELEKEIKDKLFIQIKDKKQFNQYFSQITAPSEMSFFAREEKDFIKIVKSDKKIREKLLSAHFIKYYWIRNSYVGPQVINRNFLQERIDNYNVKEEQVKKRNKFKISSDINEMVNIINFCTIWQDQRKENILKSISYVGMYINELSHRTKISKRLLGYLGINDIKKLKKINDLNKIISELMKRVRGVLFVIDEKGEERLIDENYKKYVKIKKSKESLNKEKNVDLHGTTACEGTAIGKVRICKDIQTINLVESGDVLVTSMTRPEFMPAIKLAAAIITDEGGITCHAAIIARELNIPTIIGTKIATKVLKNGMIVEVKASHGIVKIIK